MRDHRDRLSSTLRGSCLGSNYPVVEVAAPSGTPVPAPLQSREARRWCSERHNRRLPLFSRLGGQTPAAEVPGYPRETDSAASYSFAVCARVPSATYVRCRRRLWRPRCRGNTLNVSWRRTPRERSVCRHVGCCSPAAWWMPKKAKRSATYPERPEASCANTGLSGRSGGRPGDRGASSPR
jgi:hypothetical protein